MNQSKSSQQISKVMSKKSNNQGRAYEFACLHSLHQAISNIRPASIRHNSSYTAAHNAWDTLSAEEQMLYTLSAESTINTIFALEPRIVERSSDDLQLYLQPDTQGREADVRDIIIERTTITWEIGLSLKHNHSAVKHSRLSKSGDFGAAWYGVECSPMYWQAVNPIFELLERYAQMGVLFGDIPKKGEQIYLPILNAFVDEVQRALNTDRSVPRKLVSYLLSKYDFYKVISHDSKRLTTIQSFNMNGTLNQASAEQTPKLKAPITKLPTKLLHIGLKDKSKTTVLACFDNGWQFSFRIHNAEKVAKPSLKFDVRIIGMPTEINIKYSCLWNA